MGERDEQKAKMLAVEARRMRGAPPQLGIEACVGGYVVTIAAEDYGPASREVAGTPEALVALVQRWARDASEKLPR